MEGAALLMDLPIMVVHVCETSESRRAQQPETKAKISHACHHR
jgi:hypothetical protein